MFSMEIKQIWAILQVIKPYLAKFSLLLLFSMKQGIGQLFDVRFIPIQWRYVISVVNDDDLNCIIFANRFDW